MNKIKLVRIVLLIIFLSPSFVLAQKNKKDIQITLVSGPLPLPIYDDYPNIIRRIILKKEKYNLLFKDYFLKSFTSRLSDYSDPKINVLSSEKKNENYTMVYSLLLATDKKPEVKINWRVYTKNPQKLLIRDVIIEGLSLARTQKEEFSSIIENNSGDINALFIK